METSMVVRVSILGLLGGLLASPGLAAPETRVQLTVEVMAAVDALPCSAGEVLARPARAEPDAEAAALPEPTRAPASVPSETELLLVPGEWEVEFSASGCWSAMRRVTLGVPGESRTLDSAKAELRLWPLSWLTGRLTKPANEDWAEHSGSLRIEVAASFEVEGVGREMGGLGRQRCSVDEDYRFRCPVPARPVDARLWRDGFTPAYRWGLTPVGDSELDLGTITLRKGASLSGWVVLVDGEPLEDAELWASVVPEGLGDAERSRSRVLRDFVSIDGTIDENGFLQVAGLEQGSHLLRVGGEGYAVASTPVLLVEGKESVLREPLELRPPTKVTFAILPPAPADGGNWQFTLLRVNRYRSFYEEVVDLQVGFDGWVEATVEPGKYRVKVAYENGDGVADVEIDTETALLPIEIEVESVFVTGELSLGGEPLPGVLYFGGERGAERATSHADEEGRFEVVLSRSGSWPVDIDFGSPTVRARVSSVEVPRPEGAEPVVVDIELPDTRIFGRVVDTDGAPPDPPPLVYASHGAWVNVWQRTDETGGFDFLGLPEGPIDLYAMSGSARSDTRVVRTRDGQETEINLRLREFSRIPGRVVGPAGPLPGAQVIVVPADDPVAFFPSETSDAEGRFTALVTAGSSQVLVTASTLGYTLTVERRQVPETGELVIALDRQGGRLLVERPREMTARGAPSLPLVFREGVPFARGEVEKWSALHPADDVDAKWMAIPALAPGRYDVCTVPATDLSAWLRAPGPLRPSLCETVQLSSHGEARVSLPSLRPGDDR